MILLGDVQARGKAAAFESGGGGHADQFRMVVVLAQVAEDKRRGTGGEIVPEKIGNDVVREMAVAAHHALLYGPWIRADLEHFDIVIGFEQQNIRGAQMVLDGIWDVAKIGGNPDFDARGAKGVADRIDGIVRNGETVDRDIADRERTACLETFDGGFAGFPIDDRRGALRNVDGNGAAQFAEEAAEAGNVIGVFVGDEDGVEPIKRFARGGETLHEIAYTQARVNEEARRVGGNQRRVAGTAAG